MFEIRRYQTAAAEEWNGFVERSKNGTFLFNRSYMDYHADRFSDYSLMVYRRGKLYALLPANRVEQTLYSHQGLTYGGLIMTEKTTAADVVAIFRLMNEQLRAEDFQNVVYKPVPWIYHDQPSEEDLYAITKVCGARLSARGLSSTITKKHLNKWYRIRECGVRHAKQAGVKIEESDDLQKFWSILSDNLHERYGIVPVHTIEEIQLLRQRFPNQIRLITAKENNVMIAGCVLYITNRVIHSQYIAANARGKEVHALDLLFQTAIAEALKTHAYFDFGISTEEHGTYLNEQLIYQKEGFGGRGVCYDWYEWTL